MSLTKRIKETFAQATLQNEASKGLRGDDWAVYRQIEDDHLAMRREAERNFFNEYDTRVEVMRRYLIDRAASKGRALKPAYVGRDVFDKAAITRQAHRAVRAQHELTLGVLDEQKSARIADLLNSAQKRQDLGDQVRQDFRQASDRRTGKDRRAGPSR